MKKLFLLLSILPTMSMAQSFPTTITAQRAINNTNVTSKTGSHSITPINVGGDIDSCWKYLGRLYDTVHTTIIAPGNLQSVLTAGNTATLPIILDNSVYKTQYDFAGMNTYLDAGTVSQCRFGLVGTTPTMDIKDPASANHGRIIGGSLSALRTCLLPDEGNGTGVASTIVLHTTKNSILVDNGTNQANHSSNQFTIALAGGANSVFNASTIGFTDNSGNTFQSYLASNVGNLFYFNVVSGFSHTLSYPTLTATRGVLLPDEGNGTGLASTLVTHTTINPITIGDISTSASYIDASSIKMYNTGIVYNQLISGGSGGELDLYNIAGGFNARLATSTLSGNVDIKTPSHSGTLAIDNGISYTSGAVVGMTSFVITHFMSFTPRIALITPDDGPSGTGLIGYWIDTYTSTTFTVHVTPAYTGAMNFHWQAF